MRRACSYSGGHSLRILIVRREDTLVPPRYLEVPKTYVRFEGDVQLTEHGTERVDNPAWLEFNKTSRFYDPWHVMINPTLISSSGIFQWEEACLSVPQKAGKVVRPEESIFRYWTPQGVHVAPQRARKEGSACICHELDHLNGVLYFDNALSSRDTTEDEDKVCL